MDRRGDGLNPATSRGPRNKNLLSAARSAKATVFSHEPSLGTASAPPGVAPSMMMDMGLTSQPGTTPKPGGPCWVCIVADIFLGPVLLPSLCRLQEHLLAVFLLSDIRACNCPHTLDSDLQGAEGSTFNH
uniref:Uncharacterized protein n=1 Tax=Molossus molossus TaxID=27622 RepID=A0A7J8BM92_MOLMO|nr:hypothetical protein HJG59_010111 [Molossus molossus]